MDTTLKPGDDFFAYVNAKWLAKTEIPADPSLLTETLFEAVKPKE